MKEYKLKDIAKIISGGTAPKENFFDESIGIPFIRAGHLEMLCNGNSMDYIPKIKDEKLKGLVKVPKDTIVFAKSGMSCMKARVYKLEKEAYIVNHLVGIICDELVEPNYLKYYFKYNKPNKLVLDSSYPSIRLSDISEIRIKLPSNEIQLKVSNILDKAQNLIDKRKEQLEALDELVKSKFIEMFGDPYLNPKRWAKKELKEIMLLANNGLSRRGNDLDGNIVLRLVELQDGYLDYTSVNRIKLTESEEKRYLLKDGDFLFARVNGNPDNVGRCAYYQEIGEKVFHNDHIIRVRFDNTLINNCFVSTMLNSGYGKLQMKDKLKTSAGQYTVNQTGISEIKVVVPPIELQNKFEDFVKQVDKLKFEMEKSLKELEDNFNSLMQKAFRGELFK
ncbi:restriction endonuclease subunit S [Clostridium perfringens]